MPYCVFQLAQSGADGDGPEEALKELDWMRRLSAEFGLPVSFLILQVLGAPDLWRELLDGAWDARRDGAVVVPQVANRPFGMLLGLTNRHPFVMRPTFAELAARHDALDDLDALVAELAKPEVRAQILAEGDTAATDDRFATMGMIAGAMPHLAFPLDDDVDYEPEPADSLAARAEALGVSPLELFYDLMLERRRAQDVRDPLLQLLRREPRRDLRDAHAPGERARPRRRRRAPRDDLRRVDADVPAVALGARPHARPQAERRGGGEDADRTTPPSSTGSVTAARSRRASGPTSTSSTWTGCASTCPVRSATCPAAARRLLQDATGYVATIVSGVVTRRDDRDTGARPGRLVRGAR